MAQPTIISGPAFILHASYAYYTKGDVKIHYDFSTWNPRAAIAGDLGERMKGKIAMISIDPVGMYTAATAAKYWPHLPSAIGGSILTGTVAVVPMVGNKITFARGGIMKPPGVKLSSQATLWKSMEFIAMGDVSVVPTNAAAFQTIAATTADTSFDETKILSPRYTCTFTGADAAPQTAVEPDDDGFDVDLKVGIKIMSSANYGQLDARLDSIGVEAVFAPLSLDEATQALAAGLQNATAVQPGDNIGQATDLVISGTGVSLTLKKMGISDFNLQYGVGQWRQGKMKFANKLYSTSGVINPPWVWA